MCNHKKQILGLKKNGTENSKKVTYKSMVDPHLEYCVQFQSYHIQKDTTAAKAVQSRATKMIRGMKRLPLGPKRMLLLSSERRLTRYYVLEICKIINGMQMRHGCLLFIWKTLKVIKGNSLHGEQLICETHFHKIYWGQEFSKTQKWIISLYS